MESKKSLIVSKKKLNERVINIDSAEKEHLLKVEKLSTFNLFLGSSDS